MSKATRNAKKLAEKIIHPPYLRTDIPAGMAGPGSPLGPQLGQVNFLFKKNIFLYSIFIF